MTNTARDLCAFAVIYIKEGDYPAAIERLRLALRGTTHPRAKSKLMLAIRELKRAIN